MRHNCLLLASLLSVMIVGGCGFMPQTKLSSGEKSLRNTLPSNVQVRTIDATLIDEIDEQEQLQFGKCVSIPCPDGWDYRVGPGDVLSIVVFDHPQLTIPAGTNRTRTETGNRVHGDGTIFYPYVGQVDVFGKTVTEIREIVTTGLKKIIPRPQVDVSIAQFRESNQVYVLGEVGQPGPLELGMSRLSVTDALAQSGGVDKSNANAKGIFVFRGRADGAGIDVYQLNAQLATAFLWGTRFNLQAQDVVYVTAAPAARWGRIISKIVPSLSVLTTLLLLEDRL